MENHESAEEIIQTLVEQGIEKVKLAVTDTDGILRGKLVGFEKFRSITEKGFGFCDVVFGWDATDSAYDNARFTGWHTGYPDAQARVDLNTLRRVPWENDLPMFLADFVNPDGSPLAICPRSLLQRILAEAKHAGFGCQASQEFEWYNFLDNSTELYSGNFRDLKPMSQGMFGYSILRASQHGAYFHDLFDQLKKFNVPLEGLHTETGPGVYEAAIEHAGALEAADRAVLFKTAVKEIAHRHGLIASFMAKFSQQLPGCSGHIHQSLWSADGKKNLFFDPSGRSGMSLLMEQYIAGQLLCLPELLPMYAPTVNSYKRLVEGAWAPTTVTWAVDNRTTALRALPGGSASCRLETRVVGSDSNPYLAMAACLASGIYGVRKQLKLEIPPTRGSGYADQSHGVLPKNLWEASQQMKHSSLARELFGDEFVEHFTSSREWEWRQFAKAVTDWELKRYLEII
jgi:glutamine synthetase